jgi:hypothetical protein
MKRSGQVGLAVMGVVAFAATFASVKAFQGGPAPTGGAQSAAQSAAETCATRSDGSQSCEAARRGFTYYLVPHFVHGWWSGSSAKPQPAAFAGSAPKSQSAALTNGARTSIPSASGVERGGFGTSAQTSFRTSAGG